MTLRRARASFLCLATTIIICLSFTQPSCSGSVAICENQIKVDGIAGCSGVAVTVAVVQDALHQISLGATINEDQLALPATISGDSIQIGAPPGVRIDTNRPVEVSIAFPQIPATCEAAGRTFKFTGTLAAFRKENNCFELPFSNFVSQ